MTAAGFRRAGLGFHIMSERCQEHARPEDVEGGGRAAGQPFGALRGRRAKHLLCQCYQALRLPARSHHRRADVHRLQPRSGDRAVQGTYHPHSGLCTACAWAVACARPVHGLCLARAWHARGMRVTRCCACSMRVCTCTCTCASTCKHVSEVRSCARMRALVPYARHVSVRHAYTRTDSTHVSA